MAVPAEAVSDLFHQLLSVTRSLKTLSGKQPIGSRSAP